MPVDLYDDPEIFNSDGESFKFERPGDHLAGVITDMVKSAGAGMEPVIKYTLKLEDGSSRSFFGGGKNLKGQLYTLRPRAGDHLDITLIELRATGMPSPLKVFDVKCTPATLMAGNAPVQPLRPAPASVPDNDDLFAS
jgi:hypothetical protein